MPHVTVWQREEANAIIDRAASALSAGAIVALPTDTGCALACSALHAEAASRLAVLTSAANQDTGARPALALTYAGQLFDWVPHISALGMRLARRVWPGPVILTNAEGLDAGLLPSMPDATRACLEPTPAFRVPDHDIVHELLRVCSGPLLLAPAPRTGARPLAESLGEQVSLLIEDAESSPPRAATVLHVAGQNWKILQEGAVSAADVERLMACRILFVCTGNTCRSPLAAALCAKLLAERLDCTPQELPQRGYLIDSAGLAASGGGTATPEAVEIARELGADLSAHRSKLLTLSLLFRADHLLAMTHSHVCALSGYNMPGGPEPRLLAADGSDVPDPIGGSPDVYRDCAQQILLHLEALVSELRTKDDAP